MANPAWQYHYLERLSMEELENLLQLAVDPRSDQEDSAYIDAILEVMVEREKQHPTGRMTDVDQAWREFQQYYQTEGGQNEAIHYTEGADGNPRRPQGAGPSSRACGAGRGRLRRTLAAAVVTVLLVAAAVPVSGHGSIVQMVAKWTAEQFYFAAGGDRQGQTEQTAPVPDEFAELQEALAERGVSQVLVPRDMPEGFALFESNFSPFNGNKITSFTTYKRGDDYILFDITWTVGDVISQYEKDSNVETFCVGGIDHYFFTNYDLCNVVWNSEGVEYSVSTTLPKEDLIDLINSIYEV